jgi:hypothetical protein
MGKEKGQSRARILMDARNSKSLLLWQEAFSFREVMKEGRNRDYYLETTGIVWVCVVKIEGKVRR